MVSGDYWILDKGGLRFVVDVWANVENLNVGKVN